MTEALLRSGEVAKRAHVNVETLRHYERLRLIDVSARTEANHRLYASDTVERVQFIRKAQAFGLSLVQIRRVLNTEQQGGCRCAAAAELLAAHLVELDQILRRLHSQRDAIRAALSGWEQERGSATGAACRGHFCHVIEDCEPVVPDHP